MLNNERRRREMLTLAALLGTCIEAIKEPRFQHLILEGPQRFLAALDEEHRKFSTAERQRDLRLARRAADDMFPSGWAFWSVDQQLLYAALAVNVIIKAGWRVPTHDTLRAFVQSFYDMSTTLTIKNSLPDSAMQRLKTLPAIMRGQGLFI
jgi:hypothetical protein